MSVFTLYECEVVKLLVGDRLPVSELDDILATATALSEDHTGVGYFLTVRHPILPTERIVCNHPTVTGRLGDLTCGFVVFIEDGTLTIECHGWGGEDLPRDIRERAVAISSG